MRCEFMALLLLLTVKEWDWYSITKRIVKCKKILVLSVKISSPKAKNYIKSKADCKADIAYSSTK